MMHEMSSALKQTSSMYGAELQDFLGDAELEELSLYSKYKEADERNYGLLAWQMHCSLYAISPETDNKEQNFTKLTSFIKKSVEIGNSSGLQRKLSSVPETCIDLVEQGHHSEAENWAAAGADENTLNTADLDDSFQRNAASVQGTMSNASMVFTNSMLGEVLEFEKCGNGSSPGLKEQVIEANIEKEIFSLSSQELAISNEFEKITSPVHQSLTSEAASKQVDEGNLKISLNDEDINELKLSGSSSSSDGCKYSSLQSYKVLRDSFESTYEKNSIELLSQFEQEMNSTHKMGSADALPPSNDVRSQLRDEVDEPMENKDQDSSILELEASLTSYTEFLQQSLNSLSLLDVEEESQVIEDVHKVECTLIPQMESSVVPTTCDKSFETPVQNSPLCDNVEPCDSMKTLEENVGTKQSDHSSGAVPSLGVGTKHGILDTSGHYEPSCVMPDAANELCKGEFRNLSTEPKTGEMQRLNDEAENENTHFISSSNVDNTHSKTTSSEVTVEDESKIVKNVYNILKKEGANILSPDSFKAQHFERSELQPKHCPSTKFSQAPSAKVQESSRSNEVQLTQVSREPIQFPKSDEVVERKAYMEPFISSDPSENRDNEDPRWDVLRRITCDEDRVRKIRELWSNVVTPDPNVNMTRHARKVFINACSKQGHKLSHISVTEKKAVLQSILAPHLQTSRKRARDSTADYDVVMPPSKRQKLSAVSDLGFIKEKMMECERIVHEDFSELCRRVGPRLPHYKKRRLSNDYEKKMSHIANGLSEAERLHLFYSGVSRNEETKREWTEMEHLYQAFRKYYNWQGNEFCTINS